MEAGVPAGREASSDLSGRRISAKRMTPRDERTTRLKSLWLLGSDQRESLTLMPKILILMMMLLMQGSATRATIRFRAGASSQG